MINREEILLSKGQYLAPAFKTYHFGSLLLGVTEYLDPVPTGVLHAQEQPMISYVLQGGNLENRKGTEVERPIGAINFYHAWELHQNIYVAFPSKHLSLEIEDHFLKDNNLTEEMVGQAISP